MERRASAIVPDIGRDPAGERRGVQPLEVGNLMNEAALREDVQQIGLERGH